MKYIIALVTILALAIVASADTLEKAQQLAAESKWAEAIDTYGKSLASMNAAAYRDKKDFDWILEEYEKTAGGDYTAMKKVATDLLAKNKGQELFEWRLNRLLAQIALKQGDADAQAKALDATIASYNAKVEGEPSKHSSLQHLYNERAMLMAEKDPKAAEDYILKSFKADPRFVYFFGHPWEQFYQEKNQPQAYTQLLQRARRIYDE